MATTQFDAVLISAYQEFRVPVDSFFADDELTEKFVTYVSSKVGSNDLDSQDVMRRLMTLRKMGRLPRLQRAYRGRHVRTS